MEYLIIILVILYFFIIGDGINFCINEIMRINQQDKKLGK